MVAIYARQSVDKKDSISIETQIDLCTRELAGEQEYAVYSDRGYSGSNMKRPEFQRMLADVEEGKIERIITYRLDRISRSVLDFSNLIALFGRYGVSFNSTQEKFDTGSPMGKAMLNIAMVFAQLERETIQQRIRDNYYSRGEKGMYLGGPAPYGFAKIEIKDGQGKQKLLREDVSTSGHLKCIFSRYADEGLSLGEIARSLNSRAIPSPNGRQWDSSKISRILRNPVYVRADAEVYAYYRDRGCSFTNEVSDFVLGRGCYLYGKREANERKYTDVTDHVLSLAPHEGLIEPDAFLRCQRRLDSNLQIDNRRQSKITWLTGLIKCRECGRSVVPKSSNGGRYTYLYCTGRTSSGCTTRGSIGDLRELEDIVRERVFKWAGSYSGLRAASTQGGGLERNRLLCRLEQISADIQKLVDAVLAANDITAGYLNERISALEAQRVTLELELDKLSEGSAGGAEIADLTEEWESLSVAQKNAITSLLIGRIALGRDKIEIEWRYDFAIA